jgi:HEAT repeat protein
MVSHSNAEVRLDAVRLLGRIGTSASLIVLNEALNDENGIVRLQAKSAIKQIESRE